jgi:hypothetical protein
MPCQLVRELDLVALLLALPPQELLKQWSSPRLGKTEHGV